MILVTTAIEDTWGQKEKILFLGEWCKLYKRKKVWSKRNFVVANYHWDNREKLYYDEKYLNIIHDKLLKIISENLNITHNVNFNETFWKTIIDPWLIYYVSSMWDKWENIRCLSDKNK